MVRAAPSPVDAAAPRRRSTRSGIWGTDSFIIREIVRRRHREVDRVGQQWRASVHRTSESYLFTRNAYPEGPSHRALAADLE